MSKNTFAVVGDSRRVLRVVGAMMEGSVGVEDRVMKALAPRV